MGIFFKKYLIYIILVFLAILFVSKVVVLRQPKESIAPVGQVEKKFYSINGLEVSKEVSVKRPFAVMVENHPDSRPQSGLSAADVVYETLAEGGITRFLALYQSENAAEIGPVRSARDYFAEIADEWGAVYAHVGGSNEVIAELKAGKYKNVFDLNEYFSGQYFFRKEGVQAPHNVFTTSKLLEKAREEKKISDLLENRKFWKFKADFTSASSTVSKIQVDFSRPGYEVLWHYDQNANSYLRDIYFEPDIDLVNKKRIEAKNVIVMLVEAKQVPKDPLLRINMDLFSGGKALVFLDGQVQIGQWKKENGKTVFLDEKGLEFNLNRGKIWIEVLPKDREKYLVWE